MALQPLAAGPHHQDAFQQQQQQQQQQVLHVVAPGPIQIAKRSRVCGESPTQVLVGGAPGPAPMLGAPTHQQQPALVQLLLRAWGDC